jgi:ethanolamine utilization cobalamin adenosyltransferase
MVITEAELRELWRDGRHELPSFPPGTRLTPAAQDFLKAHNLQIHFESFPASDFPLPERPTSNFQPPAWDKPAVFPVVLTGPLPVCSVCGQPLPHKPDHMTQLDAGHFAPKTHPRIKFRGKLDTLHALVMLVAAEARRYQLPQLAAHLDTLAAYCREIQSAEYHSRAVQPLALAGKTEAEIHAISHWPDKHLGIPHLTPGPDDHSILHWLNYLRTTTRETEIIALEVFGADNAQLAHALNRLSSGIYYLELLFQAGKVSWKAGG